MQPTVYEICIRGRVAERPEFAVQGMRLASSETRTVLTGEILDQSQLYGFLDCIRNLDLELVSAHPQPAATKRSSSTTPIRKDV